MMRILHDTNFDFIKYWRHAAIVTAAFILIGLRLGRLHRRLPLLASSSPAAR